jgi:hypothetical protein
MPHSRNYAVHAPFCFRVRTLEHAEAIMNIFDKIKDAIFHKAEASPAGAAPAARTAPPAPAATPRPSATQAQPQKPAQASPSQQPAPATVDIEAVLSQLQSQHSEKLNWRTSIVDLMKLVGLDSSLQNRKQLANELGYSGDTNDSAAMNIWLHKRVMQELAANGGKVPKELTD